MTGIDYSKASLEVCEKFSFTKSREAEMLQWIKTSYFPEGCILVCTCDRTELWLSGVCAEKPYDILCAAAGVNPDIYTKCFVNRKGKQALRYLFMLACGLQSTVPEDQILIRVKDSLSFARENDCSDELLDKTFSMAVSAAKHVKAEVAATENNMDDFDAKTDKDNPAIVKAIEILEEYIEKTMDWYYFRDLALQIDEISRMTAQETIARASYAIKKIKMDEISRESLARMLQDASRNAVSELLYGLKEGLSRENVQDCMEGLRVSALKQKGNCK